MALKNIFKKKEKKEEKKEKVLEEPEKVSPKKEKEVSLKDKKTTIPEDLKKSKDLKKEESKKEETGRDIEDLLKVSDYSWVLVAPHIAEKPAFLAELNQYVFEVHKKANKVEIRKAVEKIYKVNVESVRIINIPKKRRRLGRTEGWKKGYKKAIVKVRAGQKIEILPR